MIFIQRARQGGSVAGRRKMIDPAAKLNDRRKAAMLAISRGSVCHQLRPVMDSAFKLKRRIDKLHMEFPFTGNRMWRGLLVQKGFKVGGLHVAAPVKLRKQRFRYEGGPILIVVNFGGRLVGRPSVSFNRGLSCVPA